MDFEERNKSLLLFHGKQSNKSTYSNLMMGHIAPGKGKGTIIVSHLTGSILDGLKGNVKCPKPSLILGFFSTDVFFILMTSAPFWRLMGGQEPDSTVFPTLLV